MFRIISNSNSLATVGYIDSYVLFYQIIWGGKEDSVNFKMITKIKSTVYFVYLFLKLLVVLSNI